MSLLDKQNEFVKTLVRFFTWLDINGYEISLGEAYRPLWVAKQYAAMGQGIEHSLHTDRLAIDIQLFRRGVWLQTFEDTRDAGTFWESLSTPGLQFCWGGFFTPPDTVHFSLSNEGRK